jgi:hypothetical protein
MDMFDKANTQNASAGIRNLGTQPIPTIVTEVSRFNGKMKFGVLDMEDQGLYTQFSLLHSTRTGVRMKGNQNK